MYWHTGHENIARLLVENGADINVVNASNDTALLSAISEGTHKFSKSLFRKGAAIQKPLNKTWHISIFCRLRQNR